MDFSHRQNNRIRIKIKIIANGPGDWISIPGQFIPKTQKTVLDATWLNTHYFKVMIKGKVEQSREKSSPPHTHFIVVNIEKGAFGTPSTKVANNLLYIYIYVCVCVCVCRKWLDLLVHYERCK